MPEPTNPIAATKRFGARFTCEFPIRGLRVGDCANRFRDQRGSGLYRIRMRLRPDPHRAQFGRINLSALHGVARGFNGHRDDIFIKSGDGFLFDGKSAFAASPYARDFLGGQTITRHVRAIANDANGFGRFEEGGEGLMLRSCHFIYFFLKAMGDI